MGEFAKIAVDAIKIGSLKRVNRESENYQCLVKSLQRRGQLGVITVRQISSGKYEIIDGLHRYSAAKDAGYHWINCDIVELSDEQVLETQIMRSAHKVETKPLEYARQLKRMLNRMPGLTPVELGHKLGKSGQWVAKRMSLNRIEDKKIQDLINDNKIPLASAYALAKLPIDEQLDWVDRAITMRPDNFLPLVDKRVWKLRQSARSEEQEFYNKSLGEPYPTNPCGEITLIGGQKDDHTVDALVYATLANKQRRSATEIIKIPPSGYELLHGKPKTKKLTEKKIVTEVVIKQPIIRKGWDNVIVDGRIAYCRGDILIYKRANFPMWQIKHPVLRIIGNDFNQPQYAMNFVERNL